MKFKMEEALDHAFANSHSQIFTAISSLQRRLLLIQSGIGKPQPTPVEPIINITEVKSGSGEEDVDIEISESLYVEEPPNFFGINAPSINVTSKAMIR